MVHEYSIDAWIPICVFSMNGFFGMVVAWTLQPGELTLLIIVFYFVPFTMYLEKLHNFQAPDYQNIMKTNC